MSANEIELTFIRCQNCKSLMPSTATACGMCGFKKGEQQDGKSKVRLRQESDVSINETISEEKNRQSDEPENVTQEMERPFHEESKQDRSNAPRRDNLNFGSRENVEDKISNRYNEDDDSSDDDDSDDFNDDDQSDSNENSSQSNDYQKPETSLEDRPKKKKRRRKKKPQSQVAIDPTGANDSSPSEDRRGRDSETAHSSDSRPDRDRESSKKEINFRDESQNNKQEFKPRDEVMQHSNKQQDHRHQDSASHGEQSHDDRQEHRNRDSHRFSERTQEDVKHHSNAQPEHRSHEPVRSETSSHKGGARVEAEDGKLMGWLVNYSTNGKGASFELRVGRRFIGRQALRSDDIIIQDSALSTPHSLIQVEGGQVFLQDLMSENGTFVKNSGSSEFVRKDTSTRLVHGDIIRLGSYELIVCLVPNA